MDRVAMDITDYERRVLTGPCFICALLNGEPGYEHEQLLLDDDEHAAFLSRYPTLLGYALVVPRRHVEDVVRDLRTDEYLRLQAAVHRVAKAITEVVRPERVYILSLGSMRGNAHIHWHIAPLPPGVPYQEQQFHALMAENGILSYSSVEMANLAAQIREALTS